MHTAAADNPDRYVASPDESVIAVGPLSDALHAKLWGKLSYANAPAARLHGWTDRAIRLTHDEMSDFIDFQVLGVVVAHAKPKYEAGAARWATRTDRFSLASEIASPMGRAAA